jgi:hypothetical protein
MTENLQAQDLVCYSDADIAHRDVAELNLMCAVGLPGSEELDIGFCLRTLDRWAKRVRQDTKKNTWQFDRHPESFNYSWAFVRILNMVTVLQRDLGVHYRQELIDMDDARFFSRADHIFLHGVVKGFGGTCSSLPPVYVAVGRRLGYPLRLVLTKQHMFARWDDGDERINIECTSRGLLCHTDDYYRDWPKPWADQEGEGYGYLRSLTPRQELAAFLENRCSVLFQQRRFREACTTMTVSAHLDPASVKHVDHLQFMAARWRTELHKRLIPGFPALTVYFPPRHYPSLPLELEQELFHLIVKENLLNTPSYEDNWWAPLRRNPNLHPPTLPAHITVVYPAIAGEPVNIILNGRVPSNFDPRHPC